MIHLQTMLKKLSFLQKTQEQVLRPVIPVDQQFPTFVVGCGRSGTHFLSEVFRHDNGMLSFHLDDVAGEIADSFLFYCEWNDLPIDHIGFIEHRKQMIRYAGKEGKQYFEANPYLALSVLRLRQAFDAKFILLHRNPIDVVVSHINKDWYQNSIIRSSNDLATGYQYGEKGNHFFGRMIPNGDEFDRWKTLSRVGKLAWMWNKTNQCVLSQFERIDDVHCQTVSVDVLDYVKFVELCNFVGTSPIDENLYESTRTKRPGKRTKKFTHHTWNTREKQEFIAEIKPMCDVLGYEIDFMNI